jgi:hypothetical protein
MITINAGIKPATKAEAYAMVQTLAAGQILSDYQIQALLLYFAPPKSAKTAMSWLAGFVAKKDTREYLRYLYSDGARIVATNGHILAWFPSDLPAGYYCPKTGAPVAGMDGIRFPDINRVIPEISRQGAAAIRLDTLPREKHEDSKVFLVRVDTLTRNTVTDDLPVTYQQAIFDAALMAECIAGGNAMLYSPVDPNSAARGYCDKGEFVIMPRRF